MDSARLVPAVLVTLLTLLATSAAAQQPSVRPPAPQAGAPDTLAAFAPPPCSELQPLAWPGQPVPGGGTLKLFPGTVPTIGSGGRIAFVAQIDGAPKNQGLFVADQNGLHPIALGCGGPGGSGLPGTCGDPSPIGGTFAGFFQHAVLMPAMNAGGDVLFLADVVGGSSKRALFLNMAATGAIVKVAAPGDPAPGGGFFTKVGVGSLGDGGDVAFLASTIPTLDSDVYRWSAGVITKVVAVGDPAPGGGTVEAVGDQSLILDDGTKIPFGLAPAINASGQVAVRIRTDTPDTLLVVYTDGVGERYVGVGDASPEGGPYLTLSAPHINAWGEIGFAASIQSESTDGGLFAGRPSAWRTVVLYDQLLPNGGACVGLSNSQNPMTPLDDAGNFAFWAKAENFLVGVTLERLYVSHPDGSIERIAEELQPTSSGLLVGAFAPLVSLRDGVVAATVVDPVASGLTLAHITVSAAVTWVDLGHPTAGSAGLPRLQGEGDLSPASSGALHLTSARPLAPAWLLVGTTASPQSFKGGVLVPAPIVVVQSFTTSAGGTADLSWAHWPAGLPACSTLVFQAWVQDGAAPKGAAASNGLMGRVR